MALLRASNKVVTKLKLDAARIKAEEEKSEANFYAEACALRDRFDLLISSRYPRPIGCRSCPLCGKKLSVMKTRRYNAGYGVSSRYKIYNCLECEYEYVTRFDIHISSGYDGS